MHPFVIGAILGTVIAIFVSGRGRRELKAQNERLFKELERKKA